MANLFEPPRYIAVEGPIRVGKSTLARIIAEKLHGQLLLEPEDNPFLDAFYDGRAGAAFQAQLAERACEPGQEGHVEAHAFRRGKQSHSDKNAFRGCGYSSTAAKAALN